MQKPLTFWIYTLYKDELQDDWNNIDHQCNPAQKWVKVVQKEVVLNDCEDNLCIGATGHDGKYHQFDSYEALYAESFFQNGYHDHGLYLESRKVRVDRTNLINV